MDSMLTRLVIVLGALATLPVTAVLLAASGRLRDWFFGYAYWPLLSEPFDAFFAKKKEQLFLDHGVKGKVLDLGAGFGVNFRHFKKLNLEISKLVAVEPNAQMQTGLRAEALRQFQALDRIHLFNGTLQKYVAAHPHELGTFDFVVSTLTLCSVDSVTDNIEYISMLLKPGGKFIMLEHVAAPEGSVYALIQRVLSPLWTLYTGSCELTHKTDLALAQCKALDAHVPKVAGSVIPFITAYAVKKPGFDIRI